VLSEEVLVIVFEKWIAIKQSERASGIDLVSVDFDRKKGGRAGLQYKYKFEHEERTWHFFAPF